MKIKIKKTELNPLFLKDYTLQDINNCSIDYAENTLYACIASNEIPIFNFNKYGFLNDNRFNDYKINIKKHKITINIKKDGK
jgi:hypothetical protein